MTPVTNNTAAEPIETAPSRLVQVGCTRRTLASSRVRLQDAAQAQCGSAPPPLGLSGQFA